MKIKLIIKKDLINKLFILSSRSYMSFKKLILLILVLNLLFCTAREVKEEEPDDILEEELRAESEPIKEIKERDFKEEIKKPNRKR